MERTFETKIDEIMDWFDFAKVAKTMYALDWKWRVVGNGGVPDESYIREFARRQLREATGVWKPGSHITTGTGGFEVEIYSDGEVTLRFVVSDWSTGL